MNNNYMEFSKNASGPDLRDFYLKKAKNAFDNGELLESIVYQTKSLCLGFNAIYGHQYYYESSSLPPLNLPVDFSRENIPINPLVQHAKKYIREPIESCLDKEYEFYKANISDGIEHIKTFCKRLPKEWTVLQICKDHDPETTLSNFQHILRSSQSIYVSLLKHPRSSTYPDPICLRISSKNQDEIYQQFAELTTAFKSYAIFSGDVNDRGAKEKYWKNILILEKHIHTVVDGLKQYIGPWFCLFTGNVTKLGNTLQTKIFNLVDKFCDKNSLNDSQCVLLSMLCRDVFQLNDDLIQTASQYLANGDRALEKDIFEFIKNVSIRIDSSYFPCIMIIDEKIDHFYWEVVKPDQELCRMSSYYTLIKLFEKYESKIKNGYLSLNIKKGQCVVNPEKNLSGMEERMKTFLNYWMPPWNAIYSKVPTADVMKNILDTSDCFIYCGHGSGLQFINGRKIAKMEINSVVFLFGCDSVRLRSQGLHSEMIGSHLYYHAALCPAIVGTLVIGLDFPMDKLATNIVSSWISSKQKTHWSLIDLPAWKKGEIKCKDYDKNDTPPPPFKYEKSLAAVVAKTRLKKSEYYYNTVGFIYRGLPVWNTSRSNL